MSSIVLDASVAVKIVSRETGSEAATRLIEDADEIVAPDWIALEVAHALWKKVRAGDIPRDAAEAGVRSLDQIVDRLVASGPLLQEAMRMSYDLSHAVYDCLYLALAVRENLPLVTSDSKFVTCVQRTDFASIVRPL